MNERPENLKWDYEADLIVAGSGGGGMTAALVAKLEGLDSLILEKTEFYGGSTSISVGGIWIPNNHLMSKAGIKDSSESASLYMQHTVGDRVPQANQDAFVKHAPEMIRYLSRLPHIKFEMMPGYADYYPDRPGGTSGGRGIAAALFSGRKLGDDLNKMRRGLMEIPLGLVFTGSEGRKMGLLKYNPSYWGIAVKALLRNVVNKITRAKHIAMGESLIGRLRFSLAQAKVPIRLNCGVKKLILENGAVCGVEVLEGDKTLRIRALKGVVLAAGGFPHNQKMREKYQQAPVNTEWTVAAPGNTGEVIEMGIEAGAAVDLMDEAWWGPTSIPPNESVHFVVAERHYGGGIIVNKAGKRFTNESASFTDVVQEMYRRDAEETPHIPAYLIMDSRYRERYFFGPLAPGNVPEKYIENGYITEADTLEQLAKNIGIDAGGLAETVNQFNSYAHVGKDPEFGRGETAFDRFYSDPSVKPNPCLAPLEKPPFYCIRMFPGDLGTKGGLKTNEWAQVVKEDGDIIDGLYAVGNTAASVMGDTYPGPGCTISPAMTFGYITAKHAAGKL